MKKQVKSIRIDDELWEQIKERSSQEQMNVSEWIRIVFSKAVECERLDDLKNIHQIKKLDDMHQAVDKIWASIQYLAQNNQITIDLDLVKQTVSNKHNQ